ncbi:unnamed protein product [Fraxinus pennsylvanica]|uniref:Pentatricopeptide repeat-containing protein n=1 Tax=Fraxinus pennsylvanica TaxID=56036 RepID=A0AAD2E373_9LAMI|nr:unnamed protein product [Fraxinus pennsylvanica]
MFNEAIELFEDLLRFPDLKPDSYTYPSVLKACGGLRRVEYGIKVHVNLIKSGYLSDVVVASSLISVYAKSGGFGLAVKVFDEMPEKDVASWNNVISCYYQSGQYEKALGYFERMKKLGFRPDSVSFTTAISSCARLLDMERGKRIHEEVSPDSVQMWSISIIKKSCRSSISHTLSLLHLLRNKNQSNHG